MEQELQKIDFEIRLGNISQTQKELDRIAAIPALVKKYPKDLAYFAQLCWRAGRSELGLLKLSKVLHIGGRLRKDLEPDLISEYAACLLHAGAASEAEELLKKVTFASYPRSYLYRSFIHFGRWEYHDSLPLLQKLSGHEPLDPYLKKVVKLNLCSALVGTLNPDTAAALASLSKELSQEKDRLLWASFFIVNIQYLILSEQYRDADREIKRGLEFFKDPKSRQVFLLKKWQAIGRLKESKGKDKQLEALKAEARQRGIWESLRQLDFHEATTLESKELWRQLYFGTPHRAFKDIVCKAGHLRDEDLGEFLWQSTPSTKSTSIFELSRGQLDGKTVIKPGFLIHRLLEVLASDFYRPYRLPSLHEKLFSGRFYNPSSSPLLMHQLFHRLRTQLARTRCPIEIAERDGFYKIEFPKGMVVKIASDKATGSADDSLFMARFQILRKSAMARKSFSVEDAARLWNLGPRRCKDLLLEGVRRGELSKFAFGKRLRFEFLNAPVEK